MTNQWSFLPNHCQNKEWIHHINIGYLLLLHGKKLMYSFSLSLNCLIILCKLMSVLITLNVIKLNKFVRLRCAFTPMEYSLNDIHMDSITFRECSTCTQKCSCKYNHVHWVFILTQMHLWALNHIHEVFILTHNVFMYTQLFSGGVQSSSNLLKGIQKYSNTFEVSSIHSFSIYVRSKMNHSIKAFGRMLISLHRLPCGVNSFFINNCHVAAQYIFCLK